MIFFLFISIVLYTHDLKRFVGEGVEIISLFVLNVIQSAPGRLISKGGQYDPQVLTVPSYGKVRHV